MKTGTTQKLIGQRHGLLVRVVTILLLLYTGVDLASPQLCGEELAGLSDAIQVSALAAGDGTRSIAPTPVNDSQQNQPSEQTHSDEDCFCCCAHILPGTIFVSYTSLTPVLFDFDLVGSRLPSPPIRSPYHPPRIA